jgi:thymidylate synthase ThyX
VRLLLNTYVTLVHQVVDCIKARQSRRSVQSERAYDAACRAKAYDLLRYLLLASSLTNLGLTINARALEHLLSKLLSHPLEEARHIGMAVEIEAEKMVPTLLKYAAYNSGRSSTYTILLISCSITGPFGISNGIGWRRRRGRKSRRAMATVCQMTS